MSTSKFKGSGINFNAKLLGVAEVSETRNEKMCQDAITHLKLSLLNSGEHKQKILVNVSLSGLLIVDAKTNQVIFTHHVKKISFVARDTGDTRVCGYVYSRGEGRHRLFGLKTEKAADALVLSIRDLFIAVHKINKMNKAAAEAAAKSELMEGDNVYDVVPHDTASLSASSTSESIQRDSTTSGRHSDTQSTGSDSWWDESSKPRTHSITSSTSSGNISAVMENAAIAENLYEELPSTAGGQASASFVCDTASSSRMSRSVSMFASAPSSRVSQQSVATAQLIDLDSDYYEVLQVPNTSNVSSASDNWASFDSPIKQPSSNNVTASLSDPFAAASVAVARSSSSVSIDLPNSKAVPNLQPSLSTFASAIPLSGDSSAYKSVKASAVINDSSNSQREFSSGGSKTSTAKPIDFTLPGAAATMQTSSVPSAAMQTSAGISPAAPFTAVAPPRRRSSGVRGSMNKILSDTSPTVDVVSSVPANKAPAIKHQSTVESLERSDSIKFELEAGVTPVPVTANADNSAPTTSSDKLRRKIAQASIVGRARPRPQTNASTLTNEDEQHDSAPNKAADPAAPAGFPTDLDFPVTPWPAESSVTGLFHNNSEPFLVAGHDRTSQIVVKDPFVLEDPFADIAISTYDPFGPSPIEGCSSSELTLEAFVNSTQWVDARDVGNSFEQAGWTQCPVSTTSNLSNTASSSSAGNKVGSSSSVDSLPCKSSSNGLVNESKDYKPVRSAKLVNDVTVPPIASDATQSVSSRSATNDVIKSVASDTSKSVDNVLVNDNTTVPVSRDKVKLSSSMLIRSRQSTADGNTPVTSTSAAAQIPVIVGLKSDSLISRRSLAASSPSKSGEMPITTVQSISSDLRDKVSPAKLQRSVPSIAIHDDNTAF